MNKFWIVVVLYACLLGCQKSQYPTELKTLTNTYVRTLKGVRVCYLIAEERCEGCTALASEFIRQNAHNAKILFIITNTIGTKNFRLKYGIDLKSVSNVLLDNQNIALQTKMIQEYPVVYFLDSYQNIQKKITIKPAEMNVVHKEISKHL